MSNNYDASLQFGTESRLLNPHNTDEVIAHQMAEDLDEIDRPRNLVVSAFHGDHPPQFRQGEPMHELEDVVTAQMCANMVNEIERLSKIETTLALIKSDAETYGNALNEAAWAFIEAYRSRTGDAVPPRLFNNCKALLRDAILKYVETVTKEN